jgi:hypothetical protein
MLSGLNLEADFPRVHEWLGRVLAREAVQRGMRVPEPGWLADESTREERLKAVRERAQEYGL